MYSRYLLAQARAHPSMEPRDGAKLCYQAVYGAAHLLKDPERGKAAFLREYHARKPGPGPLYELISPERARLNLGPWKQGGLEPSWALAMFLKSAQGPAGSEDEFRLCLEQMDALAGEGELPFSQQMWREFLKKYNEGGGGVIHHSPGYNQGEDPSYRVINREYILLLPILERLAPLGDRGGIIAIDGRAAAGKTTLAALLADIIGAQIIHMDDFYLPRELRTEKRLSAPGGNIHYERFISQVLPRLCGSFSYDPFDCHTMDYGEPRTLNASRWAIVEGCYSCHPAFGGYMDIRLFCHIEPDAQIARIEKREGKEAAAQFAARWIPMEEAYHGAFNTMQRADLVLNL